MIYTIKRQSELSADKWNDIFERIVTTLGTSNFSDIATIFGCTIDEINHIKQNSHLPDAWKIILYEVYGIRPLWLYTGKGPRSLLDANIPVSFTSHLSLEILMMFTEILDMNTITAFQLTILQNKIQMMISKVIELSVLDADFYIKELIE